MDCLNRNLLTVGDQFKLYWLHKSLLTLFHFKYKIIQQQIVSIYNSQLAILNPFLKIEQVALHETKTKGTESIENELTTELIIYLPIVKIDQSRFLIGTKVKEIQLKQSTVFVSFVKVKNGCIRLEDYLKDQAKIECQELYSLVSYWDGTYKTAVVNLIIKNNAHVTNLSAIKRYEKMNPEEFQADFEGIMNIVKQTDKQTKPLHISPPSSPQSKAQQQVSPRRKRQTQMFKFDEQAGLIYKTYTYKSRHSRSPS